MLLTTGHQDQMMQWTYACAIPQSLHKLSGHGIVEVVILMNTYHLIVLNASLTDKNW